MAGGAENDDLDRVRGEDQPGGGREPDSPWTPQAWLE
jgi:hypothetical protein